jgi:DNA mismatch endonuclease (patch repair protein)
MGGSGIGRSENMRRIKSKGMRPELAVRRAVHRIGYRCRLHRHGLPGTPDLVFGAARKVIFVHGCFWHGHDDPSCRRSHVPRSNESYWWPKLWRNKERDKKDIELLETSGWRVLVIWECETRNQGRLEAALTGFLGV